jgi:peptidoglycan/xylan/chitin deacetylase (PgdA/CDA1 family)
MRAILTYHSIDDSGSPISTSESVFRKQIAWLARGHVPVVSIDSLMKLPVDADAVAITFDDGFVNFADIAAPMLVDHGLPVTLFVVADAAGRTNRWRTGADRHVPELPLLDWGSLARLSEAGVELGAHTRTHPDLARLSPDLLSHEIVGCADRVCSETGHSPTVFAYPYGATTTAAVGLVAARYAWGCTTEMRAVAPHETPALLPRLDMFYLRAEGQLERWGTPRFRYRLGIRARARLVRRGLRSLTGDQ